MPVTQATLAPSGNVESGINVGRGVGEAVGFGVAARAGGIVGGGVAVPSVFVSVSPG